MTFPWRRHLHRLPGRQLGCIQSRYLRWTRHTPLTRWRARGLAYLHQGNLGRVTA